MSEKEVTQWVMHAKHGDIVAQQHLWNEFFTKLAKLAKQRMQSMPLRAADEEDVAISAMKSFYIGLANHKFDSLENRNDLWKLLVTLTARKVSKHYRMHYAEKRGGGGEVLGESALVSFISSKPTPEKEAEIAETCEVMFNKLNDKTLQQIARLQLEGYSSKEISGKLERPQRTIERKRELIRAILEGLLEEYDEE